MRLFVVSGNKHGTGEENRRILQTAVSSRVHSVQRAVLAILSAKLKHFHPDTVDPTRQSNNRHSYHGEHIRRTKLKSIFKKTKSYNTIRTIYY